MRRLGASSVVVLAACGALSCVGVKRPPLPTVAGPEAEDLIASTRGYVVTQHRATANGAMSQIALMAVPSLTERVIQPPQEGPFVMVGVFSGPDERGRIAYVQTNGTGDTARLSVIDADGTNNRVITAAEGAQYQVFGTHLALAPDGGAIAFMSKIQTAWPHGEHVSTGTLNVWRPETNRIAVIATDVDDGGIAWFPDGDRLTYVVRVPRRTLGDTAMSRLTRGTPGCEREATGQEIVPVIYVVDVRSGARRPLHVGTNPVVSTDGAAVLLECGSAILVDSAGRRPRPVPVPGDLQRPLALLDGHLVVYWGLPTEGTLVVRSPYGSFGAGTQTVTIKVADIATGRFQTIISAIDPRSDASFGQSGKVIGTTLAPRRLGAVSH